MCQPGWLRPQFSAIRPWHYDVPVKSFPQRSLAVGDFIEIYENALRHDVCQEVIRRFEVSDHTTDGRTGHGVNKSLKNSQDITITGLPEWDDLHNEILDATLRHIIRYIRAYPQLVTSVFSVGFHDAATGTAETITPSDFSAASDEEIAAFAFKMFRPGSINVQKYLRNVGGYYYWHSEIYPCDQAAETLHRVLLFMFYLNDVEQGGETEFLFQRRKLKPAAGSMVIAPAGFTHTHRGNVPESDDKYILTSWILFHRAENIFTRG
jgi:hypothetical protein